MADWGKSWNKNQAQTPPAEQVEQNSGAEDEILSWEDGEYICEDAPEYILLTPGVYDFKVKSFERGYYNGDVEKNSPACPMAKITLEIETDKGTAIVKENFFLRQKVKWLFDNFFRAIGMAKPGKPYAPNWSKTTGLTGRCEITHSEYKGEKYNRVKKYLFPDE